MHILAGAHYTYGSQFFCTCVLLVKFRFPKAILGPSMAIIIMFGLPNYASVYVRVVKVIIDCHHVSFEHAHARIS